MTLLTNYIYQMIVYDSFWVWCCFTKSSYLFNISRAWSIIRSFKAISYKKSTHYLELLEKQILAIKNNNNTIRRKMLTRGNKHTHTQVCYVIFLPKYQFKHFFLPFLVDSRVECVGCCRRLPLAAFYSFSFMMAFMYFFPFSSFFKRLQSY